MSNTLQVLVLHPHRDPVDQVDRTPGDVFETTEDMLDERARSTPFPYYHVIKGERDRPVSAYHAGPGADQLPPEPKALTGNQIIDAAEQALNAISMAIAAEPNIPAGGFIDEMEQPLSLGLEVISAAGDVSVLDLPTNEPADVPTLVDDEADEPVLEEPKARGGRRKRES